MDLGEKNLIIMGFMGTGKSTVGRLLSRKMHRPFIDMDQEIERRNRSTIPEIFESQGEERFRAMERELVDELAGGMSRIIACGGGVITQDPNLKRFQETGVILCLYADFETIFKRVSGNRNRPLLNAPDREQRVRELMEARETLYEAIPLQVDTSGRSPEEVAAAVLDLLETL